MTIRRAVPDITTADPAASSAFYQLLGFREEMNLGWVVNLVSPANPTAQVILITKDAAAAVNPDLSIEVDDVDAAYAAIRATGAEIVHPIADEQWGVRRFFVRDPDGKVVNVVSHRQLTGPGPKTATFETTVAASGNKAGIVVPPEAIDALAAGKRPAVLVNVNGYEYRNTVAVMGGQYMIGISAAIRTATGLQGGDPIRVTLTVADTPRAVTVPADFAAALAADPLVEAFFAKLSNSLQRYHIDNVEAAKTAETRQRRIDKAVSLFRNGQQR